MKNIFNERCQKILEILISRDTSITIDQLASMLNVSNRTIRSDLEKIDMYLSDNPHVKLQKKPRIGVWIDGDQKGKNRLKEIINSDEVYVQPHSPEERQLYIIRRLIQSRESITMQALADELYVSRITIYNDLHGVEEWLGKYELKLRRKKRQGIEITGKEKNWRKAATELLLLLKKDDEIKSLLTNNETLPLDSRLSQKDLTHIKELLPSIEITKIEKILNEAEGKMEFALSDEAFASLLIHIAIGIERLKNNKDIKMEAKQLFTIKNQKEFQMAKWIAKSIEESLGIKLPEPEVGYITLHLLGAKVYEPFGTSSSVNEILKNIEPKIVELTKEIIALIENVLSVDFQKDEKLLAGLALHLRPAINRLKYGLSLRNPLLKDIKSKFPSVFGASWSCSALFEKHFGVKVTEEEVGYLAMHIGAALERLNRKTRAIIVCTSGIGTAQLVATRLESSIKKLEIAGVVSAYDLEKLNPTDFDIIISTISLQYPAKPTIKISVFVTEDDIKTINQYIKNVESTKRFNKAALESKEEQDLFSEDLVFINLSVKNKEELIKRLGSVLLEKDYIDKAFIQSAIDRERISSTAVGRGIAIPHGQQVYVKKPAIVVATLKNPIAWAESKVDIVFLLALKFDTDTNTRRFFKGFYAMLDNEKILSEIRQKTDVKELHSFIIRKGDINE